MQNKNRVLARLVAQELSETELSVIAGGSGGPEVPTYSYDPAVTGWSGEDDYSPTDQV